MRQLSYLVCLLLFAAVSPGCGDGDSSVNGANANSGESGSAPACPDITGDYDIMSMAGDCNTLNVDAPQSVKEGDAACAPEFVSDQPAPGAKAVSGGVALDVTGNFVEARLFLDDVLRFPCVGSWNADDETMTIVCEGVAGECTIVVERL